MSFHPTSILLLGAGTLGLPILHHLALSLNRHSTSITLATRSSPRSSLSHFLHVNSISHLRLDVTTASPAHLVSIFSEFHTVISCNGMSLPSGSQMKLARAAIDGKVKRYFPWQFGVDYDAMKGASKQDLFTEQLRARELLRAQEEMKWVVVSTGIFADFLVGPEGGFGVLEREGQEGFVVRGLGGWKNRVSATDVEDIARCVEGLVFEDTGAEGVKFVAGQTVSYEEVAEAVVKAIGKEKVRIEEWTVEFLESELGKDPENEMKKYRAAFAEGTGVAWGEEKTWNKQKGIELTRLDDWVRKYLLTGK
ncbi:MAG: hypothetical protein MMC23_000995 [Stictis urceolatum]|nr:hypothetical protein [Stictis urceolata]